jgi:AcrR family transcriptional regulator
MINAREEKEERERGIGMQYTKRAIMEGFLKLLNERPFDKISVVDIAETCKINRNTFYYYYQDVYALVDDVFRLETQRFMEQSGSCKSWDEVFVKATAFTQANRHAVYHIYNSINRDRLEKYLYDVIEAGMTSFVRTEAEGLSVPEEDIVALSSFYTAALLGLTVKWLGDGMKTDAQNYIADIARLLEGSIRFAFSHSASALPDKND